MSSQATIERGFGRSALTAAAIVVVSICIGTMVSTPSVLRTMLALAAAAVLIVVGLRAPQALLVALVPWLVCLGLLRRVLSGVSPAGASGDPLILVAAIAWIAMALIAFRRGAASNRTTLANLVLLLTGLLAISGLNPLQGGFSVGLGGALLVVVPMLAFWVGRTLTDDRALTNVVRLIAVLSVAAAIYGLNQTFGGLPSWDQRWVTESGYSALSVGTLTRAFGTFSSASEYATFLSMGAIAWLALAGRARYLALSLAPIGFLAIAVWYDASRGVVVIAVAAAWLMLAAAKGLRLRWTLLLGAALIGLLPLAIGRLAPATIATDKTSDSQLVNHQVQGLSDPLGKASTLPAHFAQGVEGVRQAIVNPAGRGVGAITVAAGKFGSTDIQSAESDPGNAGIAAGLLGVIAYLGILMVGFSTVYNLARLRRDPLALAALGLIAVTLLQWLNGGQYAVAFVPWLVFGWADTRWKSTADADVDHAETRWSAVDPASEHENEPMSTVPGVAGQLPKGATR